MLNQDGQRELAYVVNIDQIEPIIGSDNCEAAVVGGWRIMVRKGTFQPGDKAVYFEIDSKVPETETYSFLAKKHYKVKTQKYTFGGKNPGFYSQGLLMSFNDFKDKDGRVPAWLASINVRIAAGEDVSHTFLTKDLGVTYADPNDNKRKASSINRYASMQQRHNKLFKHWPFKVLMRYELGRKFLFMLLGKKKDKRDWPSWIRKTDEERIQNMPWVLSNKEPFVVTEKIDGTSTTFAMQRTKKLFKNEFTFYVCSRNVVFDKPEKQCFYDTNVYAEMAEKYNVEEILHQILDENPYYDWVYIQGETYGEGVQKRNYSIKGHDFMAFNFVTSSEGRWGSIQAKSYLAAKGIPFVPIVKDSFVLPDSVDEILEYANGKSELDGLPREGFVFRSQDGTISFKGISNSFLVKYHG